MSLLKLKLVNYPWKFQHVNLEVYILKNVEEE